MTHVLAKTLNAAPKLRSGLNDGIGHAQSKPLTPANLAQSIPGVKSAGDGEQQLQTQANNLVGQTFFATLLKQMHDSPFKSELFSGGKGAEAFNGLYDQTLAQHMAQKASTRLTRPLVNKYRALARARDAQDAYGKQTDLNQKYSKHEPHDRRA